MDQDNSTEQPQGHHTESQKVRDLTRDAADKAHIATSTIETPSSIEADKQADSDAVDALKDAVDALKEANADPSSPQNLTRKILHEEERALKAEKKALHRAELGYSSFQDHAAIDAEELAADVAERAEQAGEPKVNTDWI